MGKRELLIIAAFAVVGTIVYQLTAPDPKPGEQAFSFSGFVNSIRREVRGNPANAMDRREGTFPVSAAVRELRIGGTMKITVVGETRSDIAYDLTVDSTGPDEATALGYAKRSTFKNDDLGEILSLRIGYPPEARQTSTLLLRVPARLTVRIEPFSSLRNVNVSDVTAVHLESFSGDATLINVSGSITGSTRAGDLVLQDVGDTMMTLRNTSTKVIRPRGTTKIMTTGGECLIDHAAGPIEVEQASGAEIRIVAAEAPIRATGNSGELYITAPKKDVNVDVRRAEVEVSLDQPVAVSVLGTDEQINLLIGDGVAVAVDAVATESGTIDGKEFGLSPQGSDQESRLAHTFGKGTARVVLRTQRGEIVLRKRK